MSLVVWLNSADSTFSLTMISFFDRSYRDTEEKPGWCTDPHLPPCAAYAHIADPDNLFLSYSAQELFRTGVNEFYCNL